MICCADIKPSTMAFVHTSQDASTAFLFFPIRRANVFVVLVPFCKANATLINFDMLFAITNKTLHSSVVQTPDFSWACRPRLF